MTNILGAILAGGKSSRFGEENKALALLEGRPLIQHVIDRLQSQTSEIVFSGQAYQLENVDIVNPNWVLDSEPGQRGPLVGVLSCLDYLQESDSEWLLISACDTPFLPDDLAEKLLEKALSDSTMIAVAHDGKRLQPANALWHRDLYPALKAAVTNDVRGFHQFLDTQPHTLAMWPESGNHFININTPLDLAKAEELLAG